MTVKKSNAKPRAAALRVGDRVWIRLAGRRRVARIVEDRGGIGRGGRRLLRIAYLAPGGRLAQEVEVLEDDLAAAPASRRNHGSSNGL